MVYVFLALATALLVIGFPALALAAMRRFGDRAWPAFGAALVILTIGLAAATNQECPRHGPLTAALAAWLPILLLFGTPVLAGSLIARAVARRHPKSTGRALSLTAAATLGGLVAGSLIAFWAFVAFYGPDCWP